MPPLFFESPAEEVKQIGVENLNAIRDILEEDKTAIDAEIRDSKKADLQYKKAQISLPHINKILNQIIDGIKNLNLHEDLEKLLYAGKSKSEEKAEELKADEKACYCQDTINDIKTQFPPTYVKIFLSKLYDYFSANIYSQMQSIYMPEAISDTQDRLYNSTEDYRAGVASLYSGIERTLASMVTQSSDVFSRLEYALAPQERTGKLATAAKLASTPYRYLYRGVRSIGRGVSSVVSPGPVTPSREQMPAARRYFGGLRNPWGARSDN